MMFAVVLLNMALILLRYVHSRPAFWRVFNHKWVLNSVKSFLFIHCDNDMVYIFQFVNMVLHTDLFPNIDKSLPPWDKAHLFMMYDLFNMLMGSIC